MSLIRVTFKDPDGAGESMRDAAKAQVHAIAGLSDKELETLTESRYEDIHEACSRWVKYGEYVTIEIDTDAGTARVVPVKEGQ